MSDLTISGSESAVNLTNPNVQVPAPPIPQTVEDLETQLSEVEALYKDILKGFGNTTMVQYKNQQQYDSAKANAYELYKKTIPAQIKKRKAWENKYSLRQAQLFGPDYVVLTAQEVYDIQQKYKAATNPNDKELKAYDDAVAEARSIEERISTPGTYEAGLSPSEQQLLIATAYKKVASKITPRVQEFRSDDIPIIVDEYGRTTKSTQFFVAPRVQQTIDTSVDRAIAEADKELSTSVPDQVDKYGRVLTTTSVRDQEQSRKFAQFTDRANALRTATPEQAARLAPQQPKTAAQELRGGVQDVVPAPVSKTTPAATTGTPAKVTPAVTVTPRTTATTAAPPGVRGGMVVNQTPVTLPSTTTPSTGPGATGTGGNGVRVKRQPVSPDAWKDILRQTFPSYSNDWLTDNAVTHFGQDVISLMIEAADPKGRFGGLKTDEGKAAYDRALRQTSYFLNTENSARAFDQATPANQQALINQKKLEITADLGDIGLDEQTLNRVASEAARKGLSGLGLSQAVYANILKPSGAPSPVATRALESADADRIRKIGRAYNYNVTDDEIKSILTGVPTPAGIVLTEDGLREKAQKYAKGVMPQLADQIDSGLTLDEISGNYRRYAAQLLEQSEDQIDMFSGPYLQAFGTKDTGQLSLGDWVERVKSDSRFGWQYTKQANQQATDVALSIARAFGKVQ